MKIKLHSYTFENTTEKKKICLSSWITDFQVDLKRANAFVTFLLMPDSNSDETLKSAAAGGFSKVFQIFQ